MTTLITCPGCGRRLRVPPGSEAQVFTCPRCLSRIDHPEAGAIQERPTAPAPAPEARTACTNCGRAVEADWRYCPDCNTSLRDPRPRLPGPDLDLDVRRESRGTGAGLVVLAVLGGIGISYALAASGGALLKGEVGPLFATLAAVLVLGLVSAAIVYGRGERGGRPPGVRRVLVGTLALTGGLIAAWLSVCMAVLVFFFVVCLVGAARW